MRQGKIIDSFDGELWFKDDLYHREGDLPSIIRPNKNSYWHFNSKLHRVKNPACIEIAGWRTSSKENPYRSWHKNGERHRLNAPAIIYPIGEKIHEKIRKNQWWEFNLHIR